MRTFLGSHTKLLFVVCALLLAIPAVAFAADQVNADGDGVAAPLTNQDMSVGSVPCNSPTTRTALIALEHRGGGQIFANGSTVSITATATGTGLSASMNSPNTITLPSNWEGSSNGTMSANVSSTVTINPSVAGLGSGTVTYTATGPQAGGGTLTRSDTMNVSWTAGSCDTQAPTTSASATKATTPTASPYTFGDWSNKDVSVTLSATDNSGGSGVKEIRYTTDGTDPTASNATTPNGTTYNGPFTLSSEGTTTVKFRAIDNAGNVENVQSRTVKIDKSAPTNIQFVGINDDDSFPYGSVPSVSCTADGAISGLASPCQVTGYSNAVGSHTLTATATDNATNVGSSQISYTVTRADQAQLNVDSPDSGIYGEHLDIDTSGGTTGGALTYHASGGACQIDANDKLEITDGTGTCFVTATMAGNANYNDVTSQPHEVAVNKRDVQVTAAPKSKVYGNDDPALTYSITSGSLVNNDEFSGTLSRVSGESVADSPYAIEQDTLSLPASKYVLLYVGDDLTINPRPITVTPNANQSKVYSDDDPPLTFHLAVGSSLGFDDTLEDATDGALSRTSGEDVGTYPINKGTLTATSNYTLNFVSNDVTFAITPKPITITPNANQSKFYGQDDPTLAFTPSPALKSGDNFIGALSRTAGTNVGNYAINLGSLSAGDNYTLSLSSPTVNFEIKARPITVTAVTDSKTYDGTTTSNGTPNVTAGVAGGIVSGDTAAFSQAFDNKNAGTGKTLTPSGKVTDGNNGNNYAYTFVNNNTGEIKQLGITGSFTADNKVYNGTKAATVLTRTLNGVLSPGGTPDAVSLTGGTAEFDNANAGTGKTVTLSGATLAGGDASNYNLTSVGTTTANISPAPLTVKANDAVRVLNDPNPAPFTVTYTGFVNNEAASVLGGTLSFDTDVPTPQQVGTYTITPKGLTSNNYNITHQTGTLKIQYAATGTCLGSQGHQIQQPINADGSSAFKQGSTVPAKFRVCDANGNSIGTAGVVTSFKLIKTVSGLDSYTVDETVISTTPDTAFRWSATDQQWIFNINTKSLATNKTYTYRVTLADGTFIDFEFGLKK